MNYEEDEETVIKYSERVHRLYQLIVDALIRMNKLKEALLVVERLRSKLSQSSLGRIPDFLNFDQIERVINDDRFDSILYYYYNEINTSLNCWILKPGRSIVKFQQFDKIDLTTLWTFEKANDFVANEKKTNNQTDELLKTMYDTLLRSFDAEFGESSANVKSMLWIVYDERMFKIPFHLMKNRGKFLYERFQVNCVHSLKHMHKTTHGNQIYTRKRITESGANFLPMKVVSSEEEMKKLLERFANSNARVNRQSEQFDLLLLLVNPDNKGKMNFLMSISISFLIELYLRF